MEFCNFVATHHRKYRLENYDILAFGFRCKTILDQLEKNIDRFKRTDRDKRLHNTVLKFQRLVLNSKDDELYITKFINPVWKKYEHFSELGEPFFHLSEFIEWYPYTQEFQQEIVAPKKCIKSYKI